MQQQQRAEGRGALGSVSSGEKKLQGKTFYLDNVKKRSMALLVEAISLLGGRVESFLHKDVNFVVTGSPEGLKEQRSLKDNKPASDGTNGEPHLLARQRESIISDRQRPGTPRPVGCGSRGKALLEKALLEKAIRNNERLQGCNVLANARSWGVKILFVDDVLLYLQQLTSESFSTKNKKAECRNYRKHAARVVKAASLRSPFLKVEDTSRKYKPLHMQSMTFPSLFYSGHLSPFEPPPPPRPERLTEEPKNIARETNNSPSNIQEMAETVVGFNPSPWRPRRKDRGYCECCRQPFTNHEEHLQSEEHRLFVQNSSNYLVLDQLVADIQPGFILRPPQQSKAPLNSLPIIPPIHPPSPPDLEPLGDAETELALQALLHQGPSFPGPIMQPLSSCTSTAPLGVRSPVLNAATAPANSEPATPNVASRPLSPSLSGSVPDAPSLTGYSVARHPDTERLTPCPEPSDGTPDPYSLPPVLSPQVHLEPHSPYAEPPLLYPESPLRSHNHVAAEDGVDALTTETHSVEIRSRPGGGLNSEHKEHLSVVKGLAHANCSLELAGPAPPRSRSLPRHPTTITINPRKRCRSASPDLKLNKRRRMSLLSGSSACHVTPKLKSVVWPESKIASTMDSSLLFKQKTCRLLMCNTADCIPVEQAHGNIKSTMHDFKVPSAYTVERPGTQQHHSPFLVPKVHIWPQLSNQIADLLPCRGCTTGADRLSCPVSSNTNSVNLPLNNKPHLTMNSKALSACIESALVPDLATFSSSSSESDWDCELLSCLGRSQPAPLPSTRASCELDQDLLQRPCTWMNTSYESHLHSVLQPSAPAPSLCGEEVDSFSRTVVQIVEVQH